MDGIPLLSGRSPDRSDLNEDNCRRCNKEFKFFFTRSKKCNHCGYLFCSSCTDYQALLPRTGPETGYEPVAVCAYCVEMLSITSSGKNKLRSLPISKLRAYMKAYNIRAPGAAVEKDDLVEAILRSKNRNGCLYSVHEDYYRRNSVPQGTGTADRSRARDFFSRSTRDTPPPQPSHIPRQTRQAYGTPPSTGSQYSYGSTTDFTSYGSASNPTANDRPSYPTSNSNQHRYFNPPTSSNPPPSYFNNNPFANHEGNRYASMPQSNSRAPPPSASQASQQRRPYSTAPSPASPPAPPPSVQVPTLNDLLHKQDSEIGRLPIPTLKAILFDNRVNISVGVLEKEDLVLKVIALITDERRDRELREQEELEEARRAQRDHDDAQEGANTSTGTNQEEPSHNESESERLDISDDGNVSKPINTHVTDIPSSHEGLCVVCQDEHANMAIIDCGHLSLCKSCSDLVMKTTRECPLCRTRIVTEQRLLRIFRS